jgi:hypothetical protein
MDEASKPDTPTRVASTEGLGGRLRSALKVVRRAWRWANEADIARTLNPWYEAHMLRLENKRLLDLLADPFISGLHYTAHGGLDVEAEAPAAALMAGMFMGMFERQPDAKNYIECRFSSKQGDILVTVTRPGGKTPHQLRREAEAKLAEYLKTPNLEFSGVPAGHSSNHPAGGTSAGTQG